MSLLGMDEKRQVTVVLAATMEGEMLPCQVVFKGKTGASLPPPASRKYMEDEGHKFTCTDTHWSTLESMQDYVDEIVVPYYMKKKEEMKDELGGNWENFPCVAILDCWKVSYRRIALSQCPRVVVGWEEDGCSLRKVFQWWGSSYC